MPYGGPNLFRLKSYTALYVGEKRKAKQAISEYENSVLSSSSYDKANTYTQAQVSEIKELYKLLSASDEKRIEYLKNMCCSTAKLFE